MGDWGLGRSILAGGLWEGSVQEGEKRVQGRGKQGEEERGHVP